MVPDSSLLLDSCDPPYSWTIDNPCLDSPGVSWNPIDSFWLPMIPLISLNYSTIDSPGSSSSLAPPDYMTPSDYPLHLLTLLDSFDPIHNPWLLLTLLDPLTPVTTPALTLMTNPGPSKSRSPIDSFWLPLIPVTPIDSLQPPWPPFPD